jgi:hypothetical protein
MLAIVLYIISRGMRVSHSELPKKNFPQLVS